MPSFQRSYWWVLGWVLWHFSITLVCVRLHLKCFPKLAWPFMALLVPFEVKGSMSHLYPFTSFPPPSFNVASISSLVFLRRYPPTTLLRKLLSTGYSTFRVSSTESRLIFGVPLVKAPKHISWDIWVSISCQHFHSKEEWHTSKIHGDWSKTEKPRTRQIT